MHLEGTLIEGLSCVHVRARAFGSQERNLGVVVARSLLAYYLNMIV